MSHAQPWTVLQNAITEIFPHLTPQELQGDASLKELGANSIDRAEIIMITLSQLQLKIPMMNFANAKNIRDILSILEREYQLVHANS